MRKVHEGLLVVAAWATAGLVAVGCGDDGAAAGATSSSSGGGSSGAASSSGASSGGSSSSSGGSSSSSGGATSAPWLVQCFYGAAAFGFEASNPEIEAACSALSYDKVKTCAQAECKTGWAFDATDAAYAALFAALDSNGDQAIDDQDDARSIALLGHSWGGMNTADVAAKLLGDARVSASRKGITLGVAWDPYNLSGDLKPGANFERFVVLRHSVSGANDCSATLGPFYGKSPRCGAGQACEDYDYSLSPNESFPAYPSGTIKGVNVEHCNTFNVGFPVAKAILDAAPLPPLPASVPIQGP